MQGQNRDLSERAVDDSRRLAQLEEANSRLETSVQAYQDERTKLESAFKELRPSLPGSPSPFPSSSPTRTGPRHVPKSSQVPRLRRIPDPPLTRTRRNVGARKGNVAAQKGPRTPSGIAVGCHGAAATPGYPRDQRALLAGVSRHRPLTWDLAGLA